MSALTPLLQLALMLLLPPLLPGLVNKTKARMAGRVGPPVLQLYRDLAKLLQKDSVTSQTTTWVFIAGPAVTLAALLFAGLVTPIGPHPAVFAFTGDFVLFAYLLGLARFFMTAAALDTGSPFEGMGAARELTFSPLTEATLFLGLLGLAALSHSASLSGMLGELDDPTREIAAAPIVLIAAGLAVFVLAENARIPIDDPNTHLELTMIHEVMILDHSGPALAAYEYAASLKLFVLSTLLARLVLPTFDEPTLGWLAYLGTLGLIAVLIGFIESVMARLRLARVPSLLIAACLLSGFGFLLGVA
jgi:formate hydrogenlyase subunit 4